MRARSIQHSTVASVLACAALLCSACDRAAPVSAEGGPSQLRRNLLRAGRVEVFVPTGDLEDACRRVAARTSLDQDGYELIVRGPNDPGDPRAARIVVGTPGILPAEELARRAGVRGLDAGGFEWIGHAFERDIDLFVATFQDPERPGLPVTLWLANDARHLEAWLDELAPAWRPYARALRGGDVVVEAPLALDGTPVLDRASTPGRGRGAAFAELEPFELPAERAACEVRAAPGVDRVRLAGYVERSTAALARVASWAEPDPDVAAASALVVLDRLQPFVELTQHVALAHASPTSPVTCALLADGVPDDAGAAAARSLAERALGPPLAAWLADGAALDAADAWWGRGLEDWTARLAVAGFVPTLDELVDPRAGERRSPHVVLPLRGLLFRHVRETRGARALRGAWWGSEPLVLDDALRAGFAERLAVLAERAAATRVERRAVLAGPERLAGVALCASRTAGPALGLASDALSESLGAARALGANAASVESFLFHTHDLSDTPAAARRRSFEAAEGDAALAWTFARARELGLRTVLKPHLLSGGGGTWSGTLLRGSEAHWSEFFDGYERFIEHYALLAELLGCDVLSLGSEISPATRLDPKGKRSAPQERIWKQRGWERVTRTARAAFAGDLVYVADGIEEVAAADLWSGLDAIAIDWFPLPGERSGRGDVDAMGRRFGADLQALLDEARRYGLPLLVTAVGFDGPPTTSPDTMRLAWQAAARVLAGVADDPSAPLAGVFVWRWSPVRGAAPGASDEDRNFGLADEAVERSVLRLFEGL